MAELRSLALRRKRRDVAEFLRMFDCVFHDAARLEPGRQDEVRDVIGRLGQLSPHVAGVLQDCGALYDYVPAPSAAVQRLNPALLWPTLLITPMSAPLITVADVRDCCEFAVADLEGRIERATARENTVAGRLGWWASAPFRLVRALRGAARPQPKSNTT